MSALTWVLGVSAVECVRWLTLRDRPLLQRDLVRAVEDDGVHGGRQRHVFRSLQFVY